MARDAVADYANAGQAFVGLIEGIEASDRDRLLGDLALALTDLYSAAGRLPLTDVTDDELTPGIWPDDKLAVFWQALHATQDVLGEESFDWALDWDYHGLRREDLDERWKVVLDLANDLGEAYADVKDQLAKLNRTDRLADAIWDVRFGFWSHTCNHVMGALRLLHARLSDDGGPRPPKGSG